MGAFLILLAILLIGLWIKTKWSDGLASKVAPNDPHWNQVERMLRSAGHDAEFYADASQRALIDDPKLAIRYANLGLELNDDRETSNLYQTRASARADLGDLKGAIGDYDRAIAFLRRSGQSEMMRAWDASSIFGSRADLYEALGDHSKAREDRERERKAEIRRSELASRDRD